ncbi:MAG: hypothetical protein NC548_11070 [Lachnospiraceae bacterium]|nr:hypothetical protein [Lachnospiraceae bacterium]
MDNLESKLERCSDVTVGDIVELTNYCQFGSLGMMNTTVRCLKILRGRLISGDRFTYCNRPASLEGFDELVKSTFPDYVANKVLRHKYDDLPIYFELKNTEEGFDLVCTGNSENDLTEKICNISADQALVYLCVNGVVYLQNRKTGDLSPMVSEHNNHYVYDIENGKIKEVM